MYIEPLPGKIVVKPDLPPSRSAGGLLLGGRPSHHGRAMPCTGKVLVSACDSIAPGDGVVFADEYSGSLLELDGEELRVLTEQDILAKLV